MADTSEYRDITDLESGFEGFHKLFPRRVHEVLLVCSLYESFILEADGLVADLIVSEYQELNLSHAPRVSRVSTGGEALDLIPQRDFDLVIAMSRVGEWDVPDFAEAVKQIRPDLMVIVLTEEPRELARYAAHEKRGAIDRVFLWHGDAKILLAIIKYVEDCLNVEHDTQVGTVRVIILIENSVRFYSAYLPQIYTEMMKQTRDLMAEGLNPIQKLLRMRARPKILLAETFENAWDLYTKYRDNILGIISDIGFPRNGRIDREAGLEFTKRVKVESPLMPVLLQSSNDSMKTAATSLGASFLHKKSRKLMDDLRSFMLNSLGFGDFVFRSPDGRELARAADIRAMIEKLRVVPEESIVFHAGSNHFSNWFMARTEFELAMRLRPRRVSEFPDINGLRMFLIETIQDSYERSRADVITDFSRRLFSSTTIFSRIGGGSIGGKARGLAFINTLIKQHNLRRRWPNVHVAIPHTAALGTEVFDKFIEKNGLRGPIAQDLNDEAVANRFMACKLPSGIKKDLAAFLQTIKYPLAVRSSSLLEDSHGQSFAGIYKTYMIPNSDENASLRLEQLCNAIKLVYASTFLRAAKHYREATGHHLEEEKMGVVLQEIVGTQHGDLFYPSFAGVARSFNFYPLGRLKSEDGVACVALGLGKMVVEGGEMLMFSPASPQILPQFSTTSDMLDNSQRTFFALDMTCQGPCNSPDADHNLAQCGLEVAERDGTLAAIGSVFSAENDAVYDGINRPGPRLVTFAHVLKSNLFPLAEILKVILAIGRRGMACPVEVEFAVNMQENPMQFRVLQIRPTVSDEAFERVALENIEPANLVCYSPQVMGNGYIQGLRDIIFVKPESFDKSRTREIAQEVGGLNQSLTQAGISSLLIGPGRWGSADPWLGIPVTWEQISSARAIVETSLQDFVVTPSQGSHFFQNLTTFRVGYLTVNPTAGGGLIDWEWLSAQAVVTETEHLRHIRLAEPLEIRLDGHTRRGMILKPDAASPPPSESSDSP